MASAEGDLVSERESTSPGAGGGRLSAAVQGCGVHVYIEFQVEHDIRGSVDDGHDLHQRWHVGSLGQAASDRASPPHYSGRVVVRQLALKKE